MDFLRLVINLSTDLNFGHKVIVVACRLLGSLLGRKCDVYTVQLQNCYF